MSDRPLRAADPDPADAPPAPLLRRVAGSPVTRAVLGLLCGALVAAAGALILGEYPFTGSLPWFAGPLLGLVIGEVVVAVGRDRSMAVGGVASLLGLAGITWAGYISSGDGLSPLTTLVWVSAALAAVAAFLRTADLRPSTR